MFTIPETSMFLGFDPSPYLIGIVWILFRLTEVVGLLLIFSAAIHYQITIEAIKMLYASYTEGLITLPQALLLGFNHFYNCLLEIGHHALPHLDYLTNALASAPMFTQVIVGGILTQMLY